MLILDLQFFGGRGASSASAPDPVLGRQRKPKSIDDALRDTNPNYNQGGVYRVNCQRCVYAYELQRRGYDVEALPATKNSNHDPMFAGANWMRGFQGQTWTKRGELGTRNATVEQNIYSKMKSWGDGSRAIMFLDWKGTTSSHVVNIENVGGKIWIHEAQSGHKIKLTQYLSQSKPTQTRISRVDNLQPNNNVLQHAVKQRGNKS